MLADDVTVDTTRPDDAGHIAEVGKVYNHKRDKADPLLI
jgi:hypothetical protein